VSFTSGTVDGCHGAKSGKSSFDKGRAKITLSVL
jgi:hypothetical protein